MLNKKIQLNLSDTVPFISNLASAIDYLKFNHLVHRNINLSSVYLKKENEFDEIVLSGFTSSIVLN